MRITKMQASNFLSLREFSLEIGKDGKIIYATGGNGVGKSAVPKMLKAALQGKGISPDIIRSGKDKAAILIEIDNRWLIDRTIRHSGNEVTVTDGDNPPMLSPQKWLSGLLGKHMFSPPEFFLATEKEQQAMLLKSFPLYLKQAKLQAMLNDGAELIDWSKIDFAEHGLTVLAEIKKDIYDRRHAQGQTNNLLKKSIELDRRELPETIDPEKFAAFDQSAKMSELGTMQAKLTNHERDVRELESKRKRDDELAAEIIEARKRIGELENAKQLLLIKGKALVEKVDAFVPPDVDGLKKEIANYQAAQEHASSLKTIQRHEAELAEAEQKHKALDDLHKLLDKEVPQQILAEAKMPIDSLVVDAGQLKVKKVNKGDTEESIVSLRTLSTSEKAQFAMKFAETVAGKLRVICFDRFESLDQNARDEFLELAKDSDCQYFVTEVTRGKLDVKVQDVSPESEKAVATGSSF